MFQEVDMKRRDFCRTVAVALGVGGVTASHLLPAMAQVSGPATADVAQIYQLQAAFHQAKTAQDIELMMSLWAPNGTLTVQGDPKSPHAGREQLREFWLHSGSFKNQRFSLVPSFKTRIAVRGNDASLYFECHDVAEYDQPTRNIINDTFLAGTLRNVGGKWVFYDMSAGPATPLSLDRYYA
jgi:SnoaL-like domain